MKFNNTLPALIASGSLVVALGLGLCPMPAFAETSAELQAELDQVEAELHELYGVAEQASYDLVTVTDELNDTNEQIDQLEDDIAEQQEQLSETQEQLGGIMSDQYKGGTEGLLTLLLNSEDFNELVSNIHYASAVADQQSEVIGEVKTLMASLEEDRAELEDKRAEQEQLVADQQAKTDAANAAAAEAQAYYDQLSEEVQQKLAEEEAARRAAAEEESRRAAEEAQQAAESNQGSGGGGTNSGGGNTSGGGSSGNVSSSPTGSASAMVSRAYQAIGSGYSYSGYVWTGSPSTSVFTCSGVVDFALGLPRNSNSPASLYSQVVARGAYTTNPNALKYGDLVFYNNGSIYHVGIYIGGGQVIDSIPNGGVQVRSMYYVAGFMGGGAII